MAADNTPAVTNVEKQLTEIAAQYRDKPCPQLSAKARGQPTETMRPLRAGSKWGLPG